MNPAASLSHHKPLSLLSGSGKAGRTIGRMASRLQLPQMEIAIFIIAAIVGGIFLVMLRDLLRGRHHEDYEQDIDERTVKHASFDEVAKDNTTKLIG
jgi:hypothetical protein